MFKRSGNDENAVELVSPLSLATCRSRMAAEIDRPWAIFGNRPLIGRVSETTLRVRKRVRHRNSFQTVMSVTLIEEGQHTRISCDFSMDRFSKAFLCVWFGAVLFAECGALAIFALQLVLNRSMPAGAWLLTPTSMLLFGVGLVGFGRYLARDERQFLIHALCRTLDAGPLEKSR